MSSMEILGYTGIEKQGEIVGSETLKDKEYRICKETGKQEKQELLCLIV